MVQDRKAVFPLLEHKCQFGRYHACPFYFSPPLCEGRRVSKKSNLLKVQTFVEEQPHLLQWIPVQGSEMVRDVTLLDLVAKRRVILQSTVLVFYSVSLGLLRTRQVDAIAPVGEIPAAHSIPSPPEQHCAGFPLPQSECHQRAKSEYW